MLAHISYGLQLQGLVPKKVPTIVNVTQTTEWGCHNSHFVPNAIPIHDFLMEIACPFLNRPDFTLYEPLDIGLSNILPTAKVSVIHETIVVANYSTLTKRSCCKIPRPACLCRISNFFIFTLAIPNPKDRKLSKSIVYNRSVVFPSILITKMPSRSHSTGVFEAVGE